MSNTHCLRNTCAQVTIVNLLAIVVNSVMYNIPLRYIPYLETTKRVTLHGVDDTEHRQCCDKLRHDGRLKL